MDFRDLIFTPFFLLLVFAVSFAIRSNLKTGSPLREYYMPALWLKIMGAISICMVYTFYYDGGDTTTFYNGTTVFWNTILADFPLTIRLFLSSSKSVPPEIMLYSTETSYWIFREPQSFFLIKLASIFGFLTFDTFTSIAVCFAILAFTGQIALYNLFVSLYPDLKKQFALAVFFLPSVVFWGSGLLKDTITFGSLGWLIHSFYYLLIKREKVATNALIMGLSIFFIVNIKPYIFLSILPALLFWLVITYRSRIEFAALRAMIAPAIVLAAVVVNYVLIVQIGSTFKGFSPDDIMETAQKYQNWHETISSEGAAYSLGVGDESLMGALKVFPQAVNVTLFRPYPWEANSVVMLISSVESLLLLFFTLYVLLKTGIRRFLQIIYQKPNVFFCMFFSIFFAFAIGYSTYNFGALVRYKIPCIPLFLMGLFIIRYYAKSEKNKGRLTTAE